MAADTGASMLYTHCPECETTFRISDSALQQADGRVRCGRCSHIFDARASLTDRISDAELAEPPVTSAPDAENPVTSAPAPAAGSIPEVPQTESAESDDPASPTDTLRSEVDGSGADRSAAESNAASRTAADPGATELSATEGSTAEHDATDRSTDDRTAAGPEADLPPAPAGADAGPTVTPLPTGAAAAAPAGENAPATTGAAEAHGPAQAQRPAQAQLPAQGPAQAQGPALAQATADQTAAPNPAAGVLEADAVQAVLDTDTPDLPGWMRANVENVTPEQRRNWLIATGVALALLALQAIHHFRGDLARVGVIGPVVQTGYSLFGSRVIADWDISKYRLFDSVAIEDTSPSGQRNLIIRTRLRNIGDADQPLPIVHLSLLNRWEDTVAARLFQPDEYLANDSDADDDRGIGVTTLRAASTVPAELVIVDPGNDAYGFELAVCLEKMSGVVCDTDTSFR